MSALTGLVNLFCKGVVPPLVSSHLVGATLLPLVKKGGGHRPIAVGEVLHRLASKCISLSVRSLIPDILSPLQVGVAVPNGAEAIVHAVKSVRFNPDIPPTSKWILLVDFANAFNSVNREHIYVHLHQGGSSSDLPLDGVLLPDSFSSSSGWLTHPQLFRGPAR